MLQRARERSQVALPGRRGDQFKRGLLQGPGDEEAVDGLHGAHPGEGRAAGGEGRDPQARRSRLGQGADVDDDAVVIRRDQGRRQRRRVIVDEAAREVILDHEGACLAGDGQDVTASPRAEHGPGGVVEHRLADEQPGPGGGEGVGEQVGAQAVGVHRHRDGPQPGGPRDRQQAGIGGRLDQDGRAGRGQRAHRRRERALPARRDQDVGGREPRQRCRGRTSRAVRLSPSTGGRDQEPGRRPARARADASACSGMREECR